MRKNLLKNIEKHFTSLDMFGQKVEFNINDQKMIKSKLGAFTTLAIFVTATYFFIQSTLAVVNLEKLTIITAESSLDTPTMLLQNQSFSYIFDESNYFPYFVMSVQFPNGSTLDYVQLEKYVVQNITYKDHLMKISNANFSSCNISKQDIFLQMDDAQIQSDINQTSRWRICIDDALPMGLFADIPTQYVNRTYITYNINMCQNTTENGNMCATEDEIKEILPLVIVQASIPQTVYNFNDHNNPRKRSYDNQLYSLDFSMTKFYNGFLIPVYLTTDHGLISENYVSDSIDFNLETLRDDSSTRSDISLFQYDISMSFDQATYFRKNQKLIDILANLGGIINLLLMLGKIICFSYNSALAKHKLVNISFENLHKTTKNQKK